MNDADYLAALSNLNQPIPYTSTNKTRLPSTYPFPKEWSSLEKELQPQSPLELTTSEASTVFVPFYLPFQGELTPTSFHAAAYPNQAGSVVSHPLEWLDNRLFTSCKAEWTRLVAVLTQHVDTLHLYSKQDHRGHVDIWVGGHTPPPHHALVGIMTTSVELD